MKPLIVTQRATGKRIALFPHLYILHQPRRVHLNLGKPAFSHTTFMSALNPALLEPVVEAYEDLRSDLYFYDYSFSEFRHAETGTLFLCNPVFFQLSEAGAITPGFKDPFDRCTLISLWNPAVTVPIVGQFDELTKKMITHDRFAEGI
jgi:hypothetical protein